MRRKNDTYAVLRYFLAFFVVPAFILGIFVAGSWDFSDGFQIAALIGLIVLGILLFVWVLPIKRKPKEAKDIHAASLIWDKLETILRSELHAEPL